MCSSDLKFVFVVAPTGGPAQFREVKPGSLIDGMRVVVGNVKPGEHVVVDGLQRVIPGVPVAPRLLDVDAKGRPIFPPPPAPPGAAPAASGPASGAKA